MSTILRLPQVLARTGRGKSTVYADILAGTLPPPIKIGARASGWPEDEIEAVLRARIAGQSADDIRDLVAAVVKRRAA